MTKTKTETLSDADSSFGSLSSISSDSEDSDSRPHVDFKVPSMKEKYGKKLSPIKSPSKTTLKKSTPTEKCCSIRMPPSPKKRKAIQLRLGAPPAKKTTPKPEKPIAPPRRMRPPHPEPYTPEYIQAPTTDLRTEQMKAERDAQCYDFMSRDLYRMTEVLRHKRDECRKTAKYFSAAQP